MVWALILLLVISTPAFADDGLEVVSVPDPVMIESNSSDEVISDVSDSSEVQAIGKDEQRNTDAEKELEEVKESTSDEQGQNPEEELHLDSTEESNKDVEGSEGNVLSVKAVGDRAAVSFTAYANMSPSNQYALYAEGLLKEVRQDESYCLVQDTNASYAFVVGKADSIQSFTDARWWRWYNTTGYGWRLERGSGSASVNAGAYQVISNIEGYPSLVTEVQDVTRREVMFYALVAVAAHVLCSVWSFVLRYSHNGIR